MNDLKVFQFGNKDVVDSREAAKEAYTALPIKTGYRVGEAYTVVCYKAVAL